MTAATNSEHARRARRTARGSTLGVLAASIAAVALGAFAPSAHSQTLGPRDQAKRMHDRLNGVPPAPAMLDAMTASIQSGNAVGAALLAIDGNQTVPASGHFYTTVLKNWVTPWTNRDQTAFAPLNDYTATVIGMVRDSVPFNTVLSADILYVGRANLGLPAYSVSNNQHYEQLESRGENLRDALVATTQSASTGLPAAATAGVMTTRAAARAFFIAGTNRAMFRYTLMNFMCRDLEQVMDGTRATDRIRQDVSRSPGGDSRLFLGNCAGCHTGMDPMAQAFAYYHYEHPMGDEEAGQIRYTAGQVQPKYFNNEDTFKQGFRTPNDAWENRWRRGPNQLLGWDPSKPGSGTGAKSLGEELGASEAFAQCQVEKVFKNVCLRAPADATDRAEVGRIVGVFKSNNYSLKRVFAETAAYCTGE
jgi:hypothetical protein